MALIGRVLDAFDAIPAMLLILGHVLNFSFCNGSIWVGSSVVERLSPKQHTWVRFLSDLFKRPCGEIGSTRQI